MYNQKSYDIELEDHSEMFLFILKHQTTFGLQYLKTVWSFVTCRIDRLQRIVAGGKKRESRPTFK